MRCVAEDLYGDHRAFAQWAGCGLEYSRRPVAYGSCPGVWLSDSGDEGGCVRAYRPGRYFGIGNRAVGIGPREGCQLHRTVMPIYRHKVPLRRVSVSVGTSRAIY